MSMMTNTLGRYFASRFLISAVGAFASIFLLLVLVAQRMIIAGLSRGAVK